MDDVSGVTSDAVDEEAPAIKKQKSNEEYKRKLKEDMKKRMLQLQALRKKKRTESKDKTEEVKPSPKDKTEAGGDDENKEVEEEDAEMVDDNNVVEVVDAENKKDENDDDIEDGEDKDSFSLLSQLSYEGLLKRLKKNDLSEVDENYKKRLFSELKIIKDMGFPDYFLVVWD